MSKITTEDCVAWIVKNCVPTSKPSDWKRISKRKVGDEIVREFQHRRSPNVTITVVEWNGKIGSKEQQLFDSEMDAKKSAFASPFVPTPVGQNPKWDAIRSNPVTVSFLPLEEPNEEDDGADEGRSKEIMDDWSGRVVYDFNEEYEGELSFYCGPETKDGWMDDTYDGGVGEELKELLEDMDANIGAAENFHTVQVVPGISGKEMWSVIEERLKKSGAVQMKKEEDRDGE